MIEAKRRVFKPKLSLTAPVRNARNLRHSFDRGWMIPSPFTFSCPVLFVSPSRTSATIANRRSKEKHKAAPPCSVEARRVTSHGILFRCYSEPNTVRVSNSRVLLLGLFTLSRSSYG